MKKQVVIIHGGDTFDTYKEYLAYLKAEKIDLNEKRYEREKDWKETLGKTLGKNFQIIYPQMPSAGNAQFVAWKIWFEKLFPHLKNGVVLVGHSLGSIFLAKYLSENKFPKKIAATILVAAPYAVKGEKGMADFILPKSLKLFEKQSEKIIFYHSVDDPYVTFSDLKKYSKALPTATLRIFKTRGHFIAPKFPEIVREIKNLEK